MSLLTDLCIDGGRPFSFERIACSFGNYRLVLKDALSEPVQTAAPVLRIVAVAIDMPDVIDLVLLQKLMHVLADADQTIFISARDPQ